MTMEDAGGPHSCPAFQNSRADASHRAVKTAVRTMSGHGPFAPVVPHPAIRAIAPTSGLSERCRGQRAGHATGPEAGHEGADDPDGEHGAEHQVGRVVLRPDDAEGEIDPDEEEGRDERNAAAARQARSPVVRQPLRRGRRASSRAPMTEKSVASQSTSSVKRIATSGSSRMSAAIIQGAILQKRLCRSTPVSVPTAIAPPSPRPSMSLVKDRGQS